MNSIDRHEIWDEKPGWRISLTQMLFLRVSEDDAGVAGSVFIDIGYKNTKRTSY